MLADAASGQCGAFGRVFDVCVVGSGFAGITLARSLAARGLDVALMEAGELDYSEKCQRFYEGEVVGLSSYPTDESRLRMFGGSSNHWEGKCRTLDGFDFEARRWMPHSGWPIGKADLEPYQPAAAEILDLESRTESPDGPVTQAHDRFRRFDWRLPARREDPFRHRRRCSAGSAAQRPRGRPANRRGNSPPDCFLLLLIPPARARHRR